MVAPTWTSECGTVSLYLGDCRDVLPALEAGHYVTDPPYGIGLRNGDVDGHRSDRWDAVVGDESQELGELVLQHARNHGTGSIVAFASPEKPWPGRWRNRIAWNKGGAVGGGGDTATCLKRSWELIQVWNPKPLNGTRDESVWHHPIVPSDTWLHICAKPVQLMSRLILTFTDRGEIVIDPFMGSGTTGVACVRTGRRFIGIEKEPKYFEIAKKRISDELKRMPLFEAETKAEQAELFA